MKINRVRLLAMLSGLRLESEIVSLHTSLTYKEKVRIGGLSNRAQMVAIQPNFPRMECSLTGHLGRAMIVLLEVRTINHIIRNLIHSNEILLYFFIFFFLIFFFYFRASRPVNRRWSKSPWASRRPCTLGYLITAKTKTRVYYRSGPFMWISLSIQAFCTA
jgi:hypothetical protein